jgi:riboflavin kinase/FMN adenylyltransferase
VRIFRDLNELAEFNNSVVTIGTFDGVHIGHQKILNKLKNEANEINGESLLFTFYPHPRMVIFPDSHNLKLIQTIDEKINSLRKFGLDNLIIYPFTKEFSRLTAFEFVRDILVHKLKVKKLVIGYDHQFGRNREGDIEFLKETANIFDFEVIEISAEEINEVNVSSTKIRNSIIDGNIDKANEFLGKPFQVQGKVVKGKKLGREIGYPTINLNLNNEYKIMPLDGVYAVQVSVGSNQYFGMMNIGVNPTIADETNEQKKYEVHLFDFDQDIYGENVIVLFRKFVRKEKTFDNLDELKLQIQADENNIRQYFNSNWD